MAGHYTIVEYRGPPHLGYRCGYCRSPDTKFSTGMWAHSMTVEDYQTLIDRGWRRSGKYVYKPTMDKTCCPQYVIRCKTNDFHLAKSHKKAIKRLNRFLNTGVRPSCQEVETGGDADMCTFSTPASLPHDLSSRPRDSRKTTDDLNKNLSSFCMDQPQSKSHCDNAALANDKGQPRCDTESQQLKTMHDATTPQSMQHDKHTPKPGVGAEPDKPKCIKAKLLRLERKRQKLEEAPNAKSSKQVNDGTKTLEAYLAEVNGDAKHKLEVRLVRSSPRSLLFNQTFDESFRVYRKYQMRIHNDPPDKLTEKSFTRFLVDTPLEAEYNTGQFADGFGSFHQQYVLDGRIIAVGVMDILPHALSSVYLYYDPDYSFLSPGIYSALREMAFVRELHRLVPSLQYYYMGFYIHSCPKMKYKGNYSPSYLLCPETYHWIPIENCLHKLDAAKYSRFDEPDKVDKDTSEDIREVLCLHMRQMMPYMIYKALNPGRDDDAQVQEYTSLVGISCAKRMLLYRSPPAGSDDEDDSG